MIMIMIIIHASIINCSRVTYDEDGVGVGPSAKQQAYELSLRVSVRLVLRPEHILQRRATWRGTTVRVPFWVAC